MGISKKKRQYDNEPVSEGNEKEELKQLEASTSSGGESKHPGIGDSPLLKDNVIEKEYSATTSATNPAGSSQPEPKVKPQPQAQQKPKPKVEGTEFGEPVYAIPEDDVPGMQYKQPETVTEYPEGATEDIDTGNDNVEIPQQVSNESAKSLAGTITNTYADVIPELIFMKAKVNEKEIKKLVENGDLFEYHYDEVVGHNTSTLQKLKDRAKEDAKMLKKPLSRLFEVKNVKASPMAELGIVLAAVVILNFVMIREITRNNRHLHDRLDAEARKTHQARERQNIVHGQSKTENQDGSAVEVI